MDGRKVRCGADFGGNQRGDRRREVQSAGSPAASETIVALTVSPKTYFSRAALAFKYASWAWSSFAWRRARFARLSLSIEPGVRRVSSPELWLARSTYRSSALRQACLNRWSSLESGSKRVA